MKKWWLTGVLQDEADDGSGGGGGDSSGDDKGSKKGKDESDEDDDGGEKDDPEEVKEALNLFRGLKDPTKSTGILKYLATEAGLLGKDGDLTSKGEKATDDKILKTLEKHLGEYKWIAPKFAGALKELLDGQKEEMETKFGELSQRDQQREVNNAIGELAKEFKDFKLYHPKIVKLMDEVTCGENTPPKVYLTKLYRLAKAEAGDTKDGTSDKANRLKKNVQDATARLSSSGGKDDEHKKSSKSLPTRREAIEMAMKQLEEEED